MRTPSSYQTELEFARDAALLGGRIAMKHFARDVERTQKQDGTWVTEVDWAVEAQIRLRIARTFPDDNILGEEEGLTGAGGRHPIDGAPIWVIDPIDGTNNYIAGIPIWGTLIGLQVGSENVIGVCHLPALGEIYDGGLGLGARLNGSAIATSTAEKLEEATVTYPGAESFHDRGLGGFFDELVGRAWRSRGFGDCWGHMLVARGATEVMIDPILDLWDYAALEPIVREAGGTFTKIDGSEIAPGSSCMSTNGFVQDEVVRLARSTIPEWVSV